MALEIVPLAPLERGQLHVMRVMFGFPALGATIGSGVLNFILYSRLGVPLGVVIAPVALIGLWFVAIGAARRWRHWGWAFSGRELHVAHGWLMRVHTIVPVSRVQHIDVTQGPLQRAFGVATLVLHTAGTAHSLVALPGISRATAESIRDSIRERVSGEPW